MTAAARRAGPLLWGLLGLLALAGVALAQNLPQLTGRVVDQAELLDPAQEQALTAKLEALERTTSRQLVVVTVPDLQGYSVEDFGYALGQSWKIGQAEADNGAILLVAVNDRKMRIEVGDGLEGILPDALAWIIIRDQITPRFKANDYPGGISAGVDAIVEQLQAPPNVQEERALAAAAEQRESNNSDDDGWIVPLIFWGLIIFFVILPAIFRRKYGKSYRRRRRGGWGPVIIWGGSGSGSSGSSWGGGGGGGWGGGGISGGGSFGGGGASGGW